MMGLLYKNRIRTANLIMKTSGITYIVSEPLTDWYAKKYGIIHYLNLGYSVEVIDLSILCLPDGQHALSPTDGLENLRVKKIHSVFGLIRVIKTLRSDTIVFQHISANIFYRYISLYILRSCKIKFVSFYQGAIPFGNVQGIEQKESGILDKLSKVRKRGFLYSIVTILQAKRPVYPDYAVVGGDAALELYGKEIGNAQVIHSHCLDYDVFLESKTEVSEEDFVSEVGSYALYLDDGGPEHRDYQLLGYNYSGLVSEYYRKLKDFFNTIEVATGLQVIVASHPRRDISNLDAFGTRKVISGKTLQLVKRSTVCLLTPTTSLNFVVMLEKPALFVRCTESKNMVSHQLMLNMSREANIDIVDIDSTVAGVNDLLERAGECNYAHYYSRYIKNNSDERISFAILDSYIENGDLIN